MRQTSVGIKLRGLCEEGIGLDSETVCNISGLTIVTNPRRQEMAKREQRKQCEQSIAISKKQKSSERRA